MSNRPTGICRLCRETRLLHDSHLIPAGAFKILRAASLPNPNPVIIGEDTAYTSSKQVSDYLLCKVCEGRFRVNGETWVLANCYRPDGTFLLRQALLSSQPAASGSGTTVYKAAEIPRIDCHKLIYFAVSVFWRAGAHEWPWQGGYVHSGFGSYLEPMRLFLLEEQSFPAGMALSVWVSSLDQFLEITELPTAAKAGGYHIHRFKIAGLAFVLFVGGRIPAEFIRTSAAPAPECFIPISPNHDIEELIKMSKYVRSVKPPKGYEDT